MAITSFGGFGAGNWGTPNDIRAFQKYAKLPITGKVNQKTAFALDNYSNNLKEFVEKFKVLNTHPALLPAFPGAHAVRDALNAGATQTGCTVHWVDAGVDTGKVISQVAVDVLPGDTEESLHERIKIEERKLIVETLKKYSEGLS